MTTRTIEQLFEEASCYAAMACKKFLREYEAEPPPGDDDEDLDKLRRVVSRLKTHYLFPNLTEEERTLLVSLEETTYRASNRFDAVRRELWFPREKPDQRTIGYGERFRDLKQQMAKSGLLQELTALQRLILERYYLPLRCEEEESSKTV
jgi:hypothetical protein